MDVAHFNSYTTLCIAFQNIHTYIYIYIEMATNNNKYSLIALDLLHYRLSDYHIQYRATV